MRPDDFYGQDFILTVYTVAEYISIIYINVFKTIRICRSVDHPSAIQPPEA